MAQRNHFMQKDDGPIVRVPLNEWAKYRRNGYEFSTEAAFNEQTPEEKEVEKETLVKKIMRRKVTKVT